jgi:hypothetical protein
MSKVRTHTEPVKGKHAKHAAPPAPEAQPRRASETPKVSRASKPRKKSRIPRPLKVVVAIVLVLIIGAGAFFTWDYLFRYDDAQDIQGQWKIEGSNNSIVITDSEIRLTDSVSFEYELNTFEKTITYKFANYTGVGSYVFSPERDVLTFTDVNTNEPGQSEGGDDASSMRLLKVSNQAVGEPESANNNDTSDAQSVGADVVDGSMGAQQAERDEQNGD